jgi:signal transduction histidine kinase
MGDRSLQETHGILWFSSIFLGIILCTLFVWFLVSQESSIARIDQTLLQQVQQIDVLLKVLGSHNTPPAVVTHEITRTIDPSKLSLDVRDSQGIYSLKTGVLESFSERLSLTQPTTIKLKDGAYRAFSQTSDRYYMCVIHPMPSCWNIIIENHSHLSVIFPFLTIVLAGTGIWSFVRLHQPLQKLNQYLQTLIHQPIGNELQDPPSSPKGDVYQLTQTVAKVVERLHASRNQALQFSSFATHELRTPLSIIRNQLESALTANSRTKELRSVVASAYEEMLRLSRTVEDLLSLGTMQAGTLVLNLETISLDQFLNNFYNEALFLSRPKNISVVLRKGPEVYLKVDVLRMRQVFFNLLDNAIKNTPSGHRIRLSYDIKNANVLILFADTGIGIAPDRLQKIFEPFYTYAKKNENSQGAGLGLALIKWIIELHRGSIDVSSEINRGTEFIISLPYERVLE